MYYGSSNLIYQLKYYPFAFLLIVAFIGGLVYAYYKTNRQAVENKLWTGMAKETAHQLGTPISSLLGWLAILEEDVDPKILTQIKSDLTRLETISARFSKIGSLPNRNKTKISAVIHDITQYMQIRMPKDILLEVDLIGEEKEVNINAELMSWVFENLIKNSIDAIRGKGKITIELSWDKAALISIQDSGCGIPKKLQGDVFEAGVTTKKRGWGLGLALAKRIITQYHGGKLKLISSSASGTCFEIQLPIA
jgi:signal transduction histidine kinase